MSSAVLDRILAIPDYDDRPQMGLSRSGLAAIVERGGLTKDGTKAKASVLERAGIKGDRKLTPEIAAKAKKAIAGTTKTNPLSKQIAEIGVADLLRKHEKEQQPFWDKFNNDTLSKSDEAKYQKLNERHTQEANQAKEKVKTLLIKNGETQMGADIISTNLGNQASEWDRLVKLAAKDEIKSRKVIKGKSPRDRQTQPTTTLIAPETAKKVKRAIAGVKGGKKTVKNLTAPVKTKQIESTDIKKNLKVGDNVASTYWNNQNYSMLNGKIKSIARTKATIETSYMGKPQEHTIPISNIAYIDSKRKGGRTITEVKGNNSPQKPDLQDKSLLNRLRKKRKK